MYKTGDKIKVHIYDLMNGKKEIITRNTDRVFIIVKKGSKAGIYWAEEWTPLDSFCTCNGAIVFEQV